MFKVKILALDSQRNGVAGNPFYAIRFRLYETEDDAGIELIATLEKWVGEDVERFDYRTCRVVDPTCLRAHWRGDDIGLALIRELETGNFETETDKFARRLRAVQQ